MNKSISVLLALGFSLSVQIAFAVGQDRGGGKGVVCRDTNGNIQTVEVLDLWEARNLHGKQIVASTGNAQTDLNLALERSKYIFSREDGRVAWSLDSTSQSIFICTETNPKQCPSGRVDQVTGIDLPLSHDSFEGNLSLPPGCKVEQIIQYDRPESVGSFGYTLNMDLVSEMDAINLAAISLHEGVYQTLVSWDNDQNSIRVRRIVGHVMSGGTFSVLADQIKKPYVQCAGSGSYGVNDFYFVQDPKVGYPKVIFVAEGFAGNQLIDFYQTNIDSTDIDSMVDIEDFYEKLISTSGEMRIQGAESSIEFLSVLRLETHRGVGILHLDAFTGGGPTYAPVENIRCSLIK